MSNSETVVSGTIVVNLGPYGFIHYASEYLSVVRSIAIGSSFSPVPYHLYCRCLELGFKAFLLLKGVPMKELGKRALGHNLDAIIAKSQDLGISDFLLLTAEELAEISRANAYYSKKDFEYVNISKVIQGYPQLPDLRILDAVAAKVVESLRDACLNA